MASDKKVVTLEEHEQRLMVRGLADYRMLIYAIVLIVMMLFNWAPKAIEWREKHLAKFKQKKAVKEEA